MRLDVQRQPPFAAQGAALRSVRHARAPDGETGGFGRAQKDVVVTVGDLPHDDLIDGRHVDPHRRGSRRPGDAGQQRCATDRRRALQESPPVHLYLPPCLIVGTTENQKSNTPSGPNQAQFLGIPPAPSVAVGPRVAPPRPSPAIWCAAVIAEIRRRRVATFNEPARCARRWSRAAAVLPVRTWSEARKPPVSRSPPKRSRLGRPASHCASAPSSSSPFARRWNSPASRKGCPTACATQPLPRLSRPSPISISPPSPTSSRPAATVVTDRAASSSGTCRATSTLPPIVCRGEHALIRRNRKFVDSPLEGRVTSELVSEVDSGARKNQNQIFRGFWMIPASENAVSLEKSTR